MAAHHEIRIIRRYASLVVSCLLGGVLGAVLLIWRTTPTYGSETELFVSANRTPNAGGVYDRARFAQERVKSYVPLVTSEDVMSTVASELKLRRSPAALASEITVSSVPDTVLLRISVQDRSPDVAAAIADTTASTFAAYVTKLEGTDAGAPAVEVRTTKRATTNGTPLSPRPAFDVAVGLLLGAAAGVGIAVLRQRWTAEYDEEGATTSDDARVAFVPWNHRRAMEER